MTQNHSKTGDTGERSSFLGKALVAHLDVLGFKQKYEALSTLHDLFELADNIETAFKRMRINDNILIKTFSDNVMLVQPIENGLLTDELLFGFIHYIAKTQIELITRFGWVIRGGIAFGDHYQSAVTIVSKPLVEAYVLESKKVGSPFVGISGIPSLPKRKTPSDFYGDSIDYNLIDLITVKFSQHDFPCVDYLSVPILNAYLHDSTSEGVYSNLETLLLQHKNFIMTQLQTNTERKVIQKYLSLASYHNNFIKIVISKIELLLSIQRGSSIDLHDLLNKMLFLSSDLMIPYDIRA